MPESEEERWARIAKEPWTERCFWFFLGFIAIIGAILGFVEYGVLMVLTSLFPKNKTFEKRRQTLKWAWKRHEALQAQIKDDEEALKKAKG